MLDSDKILFDAIRANTDIIKMVDSRVFNPARDEESENADQVPYIIISAEGTTNTPESDDDFGEGDEDIDNVNVLVVTHTRKELADLCRKIRLQVRKSLAKASEDGSVTGYSFAASPVQYDWTKPCVFQTLIYQIGVDIDLNK